MAMRQQPKTQNISVTLHEIYQALCPKCRKRLKQLIAEKLAEQIIFSQADSNT